MSRLWQSILSVWAWLDLAGCILVFFPLVAIVRLVTLPYDHGAYAAGYLFRRIGPAMATLNPLWRFRYSGTLPANPRRPLWWCPITSPLPTSCSSATFPGR